MKKKPTPKPTPVTSSAQLRVWADRRSDPDWDRYVAALVALAMRRVEEEDAKEDRE
jgi:hypothetical protein